MKGIDVHKTKDKPHNETSIQNSQVITCGKGKKHLLIIVI